MGNLPNIPDKEFRCEDYGKPWHSKFCLKCIEQANKFIRKFKNTRQQREE